MFQGSYTTAVINVFKRAINKSKKEKNIKLKGISFFKSIVNVI